MCEVSQAVAAVAVSAIVAHAHPTERDQVPWEFISDHDVTPAMFEPYDLRGLHLENQFMRSHGKLGRLTSLSRSEMDT